MQVVVACDLCKPPTELKGEYGDDFAGVIARHFAAFHLKESRAAKSPADMKLRLIKEIE